MQLPDVPDSIPVRLHLLYLILEGISRKTSKSFIKAVKVNCSDFVQGGECQIMRYSQARLHSR